MLERTVSIGLLVNDLSPKPHIGGGVTYSSITAACAGLEAHIITKCPPRHPYINQLQMMRIEVHVLPSSSDTITSFDNQYDKDGNRTQKVYDIQAPITSKDLQEIPHKLLTNSLILVTPVIHEVDMSVYQTLARHGNLVVMPQGYFRAEEKDGTVKRIKWHGFNSALQVAKLTVLSREDITIAGKFDTELLKEIVQASQIVALTQGRDGVTVYQNGKKHSHTSAFHLEEAETSDFTGAGDVFATIFAIELLKNNKTIEEASKAACFFAAVKIMGLSGIGTNSIPTKKQLEEFIKANQDRVHEYSLTPVLSIS
jgi:sugar/nucleoside kinase (ribokinase family)